ncbi:hypothetical protein AZI87_03285 [Bdellovibrio bacteriovorus]|uniref:Outer membrane protein beta-barrel domain-containing protein n=1 Tax=Bdellovibrio bacteriovorus TaxID=959 RepID=A0A162GJD3_BDEBC|nr:hypothetical protein [Bdellovibrio bacteriovorus]KYG68293.1 hypothetical protein AZI87_03285 [Bdellovibrio bacteriovorus]
MRVILSLLFLTLVLSVSVSQAAPQTTTTLETQPLSGEDDPLLATRDPEARASIPTFLLGTYLGFEGGNYLESDEWDQGPFLSVRFIPVQDDSIYWDYEVAVNTANFVGLGAGYRWYCCPDDRFNPYLRASANLYLEGADEIAGLVEIRRWRARASVGMGETFNAEFGVGAAVTGPDLFAQFGYQFAF